jgi:segregation and condensation protein B
LDESGSGMQVMEVAGGYQLRSRPIHSEYINRFLERKRKQTLSGAALEALAIIAYKQPITRAEVEAIRGVGVDGVLKSILDKKLVKITGVKEVPGRPNLYGTTKHFLEYFGINSLKDLPPVGDITQTFPAQAGAAGTDEPTQEDQQSSEETTQQETAPDRSGESPGEEPIQKTDEAQAPAAEEPKG